MPGAFAASAFSRTAFYVSPQPTTGRSAAAGGGGMGAPSWLRIEPGDLPELDPHIYAAARARRLAARMTDAANALGAEAAGERPGRPSKASTKPTHEKPDASDAELPSALQALLDDVLRQLPVFRPTAEVLGRTKRALLRAWKRGYRNRLTLTKVTLAGLGFLGTADGRRVLTTLRGRSARPVRRPTVRPSSEGSAVGSAVTWALVLWALAQVVAATRRRKR